MQKDIHPEYKLITVELADGTTFQTRSTMDDETFVSEVDSTNHPFYTGRRQYVDTAGRVEKFMRRYGLKEEDSDDEKEGDEDKSE
ncbi:MAG: 50S ribosomal protein L31 [Bacteroidetes bacterium]|jgi:large subunit ribosomal protein L31|nr:50S ribosomal protein L31 [Bacteroidota bacterium]